LAWNLHGDFINHLDASARYLLAIPGALVAGIAFFQQSSQARENGPNGLGVALQLAAWGFILYATTQLVVPPLDIFPASILNTATFIEFTGMPIQVIRAILAIMIMIGLLQASRVVEEERQRQFLAVQQSRLDALGKLEREMRQREIMRQNLLRHIVLAQEEERARIARELHDKTSQILTAFAFHLAALRELLNGNGKTKQQLEYLQSLCRDMSAGLYKLVHDLRPSQLDDLGLVAALQYLGDEAPEQIGLDVKLEILGERRRLDPIVETVVYRVAQEALTNVARHSGVREANLRLVFQPQRITLQVNDRGQGFNLQDVNEKKQGWGLDGMRERVDSIGGKLVVKSAPGEGTVVEVIVREKEGGHIQVEGTEVF
jgi:signal transduction histidine kinase